MAGTLKLVLVVALVGAAAARSGGLVNFMSIQMDAMERLQDAPNIPGLATNLGLTELVKLVVKAGLADALSGAGPFTVFGPTNKAFKNIPEWLQPVLKNVTVLADVLKYHVLSGEVKSTDITDEKTAATLNGKPIRLNIYGGKTYTAQCAPINLKAVDQMASNGVLHELEAVMVPPSGNIVEAAVACQQFKTLVTALKAAGLVDTLAGAGPFTVFAPTDAAFAKLDPQVLKNLLANKTALTDVLTYHVASGTKCAAGLVGMSSLTMLNKKMVTIKLDGKSLKVNDATVIPLGADGSVTNGVVHAIDSVLLPPALRLAPRNLRFIR